MKVHFPKSRATSSTRRTAQLPRRSPRVRQATPLLLSVGMGVLGTSLPALAGGDIYVGGGPICTTTVDLEHCQTYLTSDGYCESLVKEQCQDLVEQAHAAERALITDEREVLPFDDLQGNQTVSAKYVQDPREDHYLNGVDGMFVSSTLSSDMSVAQGSEESRLDDFLSTPCTAAAAAAGQPETICSCAQYAYDSYYSARPYERVVSEKALDFRALFNDAEDILSEAVTSRDGMTETSMVASQVARSRFHAVNTWSLESLYPAGQARFVWDDELRMAYAATYRTWALTWDKHQELSAALAGYPDEKLNHLFDEQRTFSDLVAYRYDRWTAYVNAVADAGGVVDPVLAANVGTELRSLDAQIEAGLRRARDELECVPASANQASPCDWSPKAFFYNTQGYLKGLGEDRFQDCVQLTGDDFDNATTTNLANTFNFGNFLSVEGNGGAKLSVVGTGIDAKPTVGQGFSDEGQYGNDDFHVSYAYSFVWGITDVPQDDESQFCMANLRAGGTLDAEGAAFGVSKKVVDFDAWAYTERDASNGQDYVHEEITMIILDQQIYAKDDRQTGHYDFVESPSHTLGGDEDGYSMTKTFVVVAVPITVSAGLTGTFGIDIHLQGGIIRDCDGTPDQIDVGLASDIKPYVDLDAYLSAGIGWPGLGAGVKGEVNLINVELPFAAHAGLEFLPTNSGSTVFLVANADLDLTLKTLDGKVSVYVEYIFDSTEKEIFRWPGYTLKSDLFDFDRRYPLGVIANLQNQNP